MGISFGGDGVSGDSKIILDKLSYNKDDNIIIADASLEVQNSSLHIGKNAKLSNGILTFSVLTGDRQDALSMLQIYNQDGSEAPFYYKLESRRDLEINTVATEILSNPVDFSYTTAGDNLTYSWKIQPVEAGDLVVKFWRDGVETDENLFFEETMTITQEDADSGNPVLFDVGNKFLMPQGTSVLVRFEGIALYGDTNNVPYLVTQIQPYTKIDLVMPFLPTPINQTLDFNTTIVSNAGAIYALGDNANHIVIITGDNVTYSNPVSVVIPANGRQLKIEAPNTEVRLFKNSSGSWNWHCASQNLTGFFDIATDYVHNRGVHNVIQAGQGEAYGTYLRINVGNGKFVEVRHRLVGGSTGLLHMNASFQCRLRYEMTRSTTSLTTSAGGQETYRSSDSNIAHEVWWYRTPSSFSSYFGQGMSHAAERFGTGTISGYGGSDNFFAKFSWAWIPQDSDESDAYLQLDYEKRQS